MRDLVSFLSEKIADKFANITDDNDMFYEDNDNIEDNIDERLLINKDYKKPKVRKKRTKSSNTSNYSSGSGGCSSSSRRSYYSSGGCGSSSSYRSSC